MKIAFSFFTWLETFHILTYARLFDEVFFMMSVTFVLPQMFFFFIDLWDKQRLSNKNVRSNWLKAVDVGYWTDLNYIMFNKEKAIYIEYCIVYWIHQKYRYLKSTRVKHYLYSVLGITNALFGPWYLVLRVVSTRKYLVLLGTSIKVYLTTTLHNTI